MVPKFSIYGPLMSGYKNGIWLRVTDAFGVDSSFKANGICGTRFYIIGNGASVHYYNL